MSPSDKSLEPADAPRAPLLLLGAPESGIDAVGELLTRAGLNGGQDGVRIRKIHDDALADLDRDWTCPPALFQPSPESLLSAAQAISELTSTGSVWGLSDPLLLFMLPLWIEHLSAVRVVGVTRQNDSIVRAIQQRHGINPPQADDIARAYSTRLTKVASRLEFPVIDLSEGALIGFRSVRSLAQDLDLQLDEESACELLGGLLDEPPSRREHDPEPPVHLIPIASEELAVAWNDLHDGSADLSRYCGPRAQRRRSALWASAPRDADVVVELARVEILGVTSEPTGKRGDTLPGDDLVGLCDAMRRLPGRLDALLLPDLMSWVRGDELEAVFTIARRHVAGSGMLVIGQSGADVEYLDARGLEPITETEMLDAARVGSWVSLPTITHEHVQILRLIATPAEAGAVAVDWRLRYEALRSRRSVRWALAASRYAGPAFKAVRAVRRAVQRAP